jgi:hypothetical protein
MRGWECELAAIGNSVNKLIRLPNIRSARASPMTVLEF